MSIALEEKSAVVSLFRKLSDSPVIIDVGSNKGTWSDIFLDWYQDRCKVYMIEPNEMLLNYTRIKYDYNTNIVFSNRAAFSEDDKTLLFYYFINYNNGLSSIYKNDEFNDLPMKVGEVKTITLDTFCAELKEIDFIKIDVEGSEFDVLSGCVEIMKERRVKFIQVEYGAHYKIAAHTLAQVIELVNRYGYFVNSWDGMGNFTEVKADTLTEDYHAENYIISRDRISRYQYTQLWNEEFKKNTKGLDKMSFVLEVGCFEGITTNYICDNLLTEEGRIICVDPLQDEYLTDNLNEAYELMNRSLPMFKGQYERFINNTKGKPVELIRKRSSEAWAEMYAYRFDFIYLDGDHRFEAVLDDANNAFELLKVGGHLLFDDYGGWAAETTEAIDKFLEEHSEQISILIKEYQVLIRRNQIV